MQANTVRGKWFMIVAVVAFAGAVGCKSSSSSSPSAHAPTPAPTAEAAAESDTALLAADQAGTSASDMLRQTRTQVVKSRAQLDQMLASMNQLQTASGDLHPAYADFVKKVAETEAQAAKSKEKAVTVRERGRDYITKWETEIQQVSDPQLRANVAERRKLVRANYDQIADAAAIARDAYTPFIGDVKDIQRALSLDLSPGGVRAAKPTMDKATKDGAALRQKLDTLIARLDEASADSPPTPAQSPTAAQPPSASPATPVIPVK